MTNTEPHRAEAAPTPPPQQVLMQITSGMWVVQAVATAARLGIADALAHSQPQESTTLAHAVGADAAALTRLLRALASLGVLAEPLPHLVPPQPVGLGPPQERGTGCVHQTPGSVVRASSSKQHLQAELKNPRIECGCNPPELRRG